MTTRYLRQIRLREVGPQGQLQLNKARVLLSRCSDKADASDLPYWIAEQYLVRAGVGCVESTTGPDCVADIPIGNEQHSLDREFTCESAREIAAGSARALALIRAILKIA